ncbi:MAG: NAD(P)-dependent glycerol-3-phosphate dehydrogenase [Sedimentisphaerales bacterium]|nr:NAD(P)-dependent glycerol-3-phosphate dehydrogenase [Sedimentisphaerales bacterium]
MTQKVAIIGDGAMGTVCAITLARKGFRVGLWSYDKQYVEKMQQTRENERFLPGYVLTPSIELTGDAEEIFDSATLVISAIPCKFVRSVWEKLGKVIPRSLPVASCTKGIENGTLLRPTEILSQLAGPRSLAVISGPNIADELARALPATSTVASSDMNLATHVQNTFSTNWFRMYTNSDVVGVELAGATKNVIAIAAGTIDGLGAGDNAKAALLTRGLVEISRLGEKMGAHPETFSGLAGMGDLITTCVSPKGRNRTFGQLLGQGKTVEQALKAIAGEVEGVNTVKSVVELAKRHKVDMPITQAVYDVIFNGKSVVEGFSELMTRQLKSEAPNSVIHQKN